MTPERLPWSALVVATLAVLLVGWCLWASLPCAGCGSDITRDRVLVGVRR